MTVLDDLDSLTRTMAADVRPHLATLDRDGYVRFLDAMVHYTRGSGARLRHAATYAAEGELKDFFGRLAEEEATHYVLAEADLEALGSAPSASPREDVEAFHAWFMGSRDSADWLGALYVLENVAAHLAADVPPHLARLGLDRSQARFVLAHLTADAAHGADTRAHASKASGDLLTGARIAARFWTKLHVDAFVLVPVVSRPSEQIQGL